MVKTSTNMFDLSLRAATILNTIANFSLIVGALLALGGTIAVFWTAGIKDRYSDERISNNEAETARAKAEAAGANERAAVAEQRAAEANRIAESERLERIKIEERLAPRRFTSDQQLDLKNKLAEFAGQRVLVFFFTTDAEPAAFGHVLGNVLRAAGWDVQEVPGMMFGGNVASGVVVHLRAGASERATSAANAVVEALKGERLTVNGPLSGNGRSGGNVLGMAGPDTEIAIVIGSK